MQPKPAIAVGHVPDAQELAAGVLAGDRVQLARAITCIESSAAGDRSKARALLEHLLPHAGGAVRIGITGVPGAGKSTFIEAFGLHLCGLGKKVAVLAIDPSSTRTHGSVLGDKTRMEALGRHPLSFIRPSPAGSTLGGVAARTREAMLLCEAAGFDVVLIETVGVGQSEVAVRAMVDFFLLLAITGAGDELQAVKRGLIELADAVVINKADGENRLPAEAARRQFETALHILRGSHDDATTPRALACSALTGDGVPEIWTMIDEHCRAARASGALDVLRRRQALEWMDSRVDEAWRRLFPAAPEVASERARLEQAVLRGKLDGAVAAEQLMDFVASRGFLSR